MENIHNFEKFKESFLSNLKDGFLNKISRELGGNVKKIDSVISDYENSMSDLIEKTQKEITKIENSEDDKQIRRSIQLIKALDKKKRLLAKSITTSLESIVKDNKRERAYAANAKNQVEIKLLDKEIEVLSSVDNDEIENLISEREKQKQTSEENVKKSKKALEEIKEEEEAEKPKEIKKGDIIKYKTIDGEILEREVDRVLNDGVEIKTQDGRIVYIRKDRLVD